MTVRCNKEHLEMTHGVKIGSVYEIADKVRDLVKGDRNRKKKRTRDEKPYLTRKEILKFADEEIQ